MNYAQEVFERQLQSNPHKVFLCFDLQEYTFAEVYAQAHKLAEQLRKLGVKPKDRLALRFWNGPEFVFAYFAVLLAGAVTVTLSPLLTESERAQILAHSGARLLLSFEEGQDQCTLAQLQSSSACLKPAESSGAPAELAALIYTSGTTGEPKGVMLSYENIKAQLAAALQALQLQEDDSLLGVLSLSHVFGQMDVLWTALDLGLTVHLVEHFEARGVLKLLQDKQISVMIAVPTMYQMMLRLLERNPQKFGSLRLCHSGAAPMPALAAQKVEELFGAIFQEGYGLTETCSMAFSNPLNLNRKLGSVGKPIQGGQVQIRNEAGELLLKPNEIGEVCIKGPFVSRGYFKNPTATALTFDAEGWLLTGDLGYLDREGFLFLVDRKKDLIIRAGYKVYPREVEEVLLQDPRVEAAAVVGIGNHLQSEKVQAFIQLLNPSLTEPERKELIADLRELCANKLAKYKRPSFYEIIDKLPRTFSGKLQKRKLLGD